MSPSCPRVVAGHGHTPGCSLWRRVIWACLVPLLCLLPVGAEVSQGAKVEPTEVEKTLLLVDSLLGYGYKKSALHYLKQMRRTSRLSAQEEKVVEKRIADLEAKIASRENSALPDLEVMLHFDAPSAASSVTELDAEREPLRPESFPSNRINKKAWIITGLVIIGAGVVAYKVTKHLRRKEPKRTNIISIEF